MSSQLVAECLSQGGFLALNEIEVQDGLLDKESAAMWSFLLIELAS